MSSTTETPKVTWIRNPAATFTGTDEPAGNGVVVSGNKVIELVNDANPSCPYHESVDASNCVLLPGLVNGHHHYYQTLTRSQPNAINKALFPWLQSLYPIWAKLQEDDIYYSTQLALCELLRSGCTTSADHHYVFPEQLRHAMDVQVEASASVGVRAMISRGSMSLGSSAGGLPPDHVVQDEDEILSDCERVIARYHDAAEDARVRIALAPCSPFSVSKRLMSETAEMAGRYNLLLHTHLAETEDENDFCMNSLGMRPLQYLEVSGWLEHKVWLAHGIHFTREEIQTLAASNVAVCHCPSSNMLLGSGICPVLELNDAGVSICLGVDGSASNDHSNMIQEVRQAMLLQKLKYGSAAVNHTQALQWATTGGAEALGWPEIGKLAVGCQADLALFSLNDISFSGHGDPLAALLFSGAQKAQDVMVAGSWKVRQGQLLEFDLDQLMAEHSTRARRLVGNL